MTLENKAGLAIACTFAALAGAVVWLMQHPEASWGRPAAAASSEQEGDVIPRPTAKEPATSGSRDRSVESEKTPPKGSPQGKPRIPFGDGGLVDNPPQARPRAAEPRQERKPQAGRDRPKSVNTAPPASPLVDGGNSGASDQSSWSSIGGSGRQASPTDKGKPSDFQLTAVTTPMPPSGSSTGSSAAGNKDKTKDVKKEKGKGQENVFLPGSQPVGTSTSGPSATDTATGNAQKSQAGKGSDDKNGVKSDTLPLFSPPGSTPPSSSKPQDGNPNKTQPRAYTGFPLESDNPPSDGKPSSAPRPGAATNQPSSLSGGSDNQSSAPRGTGTGSDKPAPTFGAGDPPPPTSPGLTGSSSSGAGERPLFGGAAPLPVDGGKRPSSTGSSLPPTVSGSGLPGKSGQTPSGPSAPPAPAGIDGGLGVGPLQSSSPGGTPSRPAPMGFDNTSPPSAPGTGSINIGGPQPAKPTPAAGTPGAAAAPHAVGSSEDSIFIPDPSPSGPPAARSPMAPSPASRLMPATPTTQPGATGSAPTIIASPGSAPPRPAAPIPSEVVVTQEKSYQVSAGDNLDSLSQHFYGTTNYAPALRKYLQNDPRFSQWIGANGQPTAGARILVPADPRRLPGAGGDVMMPAVAPVATTPSPAPAPTPAPSPPSPFGR